MLVGMLATVGGDWDSICSIFEGWALDVGDVLGSKGLGWPVSGSGIP